MACTIFIIIIVWRCSIVRDELCVDWYWVTEIETVDGFINIIIRIIIIIMIIA